MRAYVKPIPQTLSQAMWRVARALVNHAPEHIEFVNRPEDADFQVVHAICPESVDVIKAPRYGVIQYCLNTADPRSSAWPRLWDRAEIIWSYYRLDFEPSKFYYAPMGVDPVFLQTRYPLMSEREGGVMTSGYVTGPGAEAIEEVAIAASLAGMRAKHLGPAPQGMTQFPKGWSCYNGIPDNALRDLYDSCHFVSGLRHVEGFEMPVIEGLARGLMPIVFDRPEMRAWYDGLARFVPECSGTEFVRHLVEVFKTPAPDVDINRRVEQLRPFIWDTIIEGFWERVRVEVSA